MKKFCLLVLFYILLFGTNIGFANNVIGLDSDINWLYGPRDVKWCMDSEKIAVLLDHGLFIINKEGEIEKEFEIDYAYNLLWLDNNKVGMIYKGSLLILNIESGEKETFDLEISAGSYIFSLSYCDSRKEFAISIDNLIKVFEMERHSIYTLIEIYGTAIGNVFYNKNGSRLFFSVSGVQNAPFMYVFDLENWAVDRVSEELLYPHYIDEIENTGYFYKGDPIMTDCELVEIDLETLEIKDYVEKESEIIIDGYVIDPKLKTRLYTDKERESIYVYLSYDLDCALVESSDKVRFITGLSTLK